MHPNLCLELYDEFLFDEQTQVFFKVRPVVSNFLDWLGWQGQVSHCLARIQEYDL